MTKTPKPKTPAAAKTPSFEEVCDIWARADHWPLIDAVNLVLGHEPELVRTKRLSPKQRRGRDVMVELARNCIGDSLTAAPVDRANGELRVRPAEFLQWFRARTPLPVPEALSMALNRAHAKLHKADPEHELGLMTRRRERCRAIAALLWARSPELTKAEVAGSPDIQAHGLLGGRYTSATIQDWIKEEKPNRQGGRPRRPN